MNTRLQVEHPVTEYVSGEDLVEHMLWVAAGEALPERLTAQPVPFKGWAMEARVYAEDPLRGFLPSTGHLITYREPRHLMEMESEGGVPAVRIDTGVYEGSEISMFYDPMIAKLVSYGSTRAEALERLNEALDAYVIQGLSHNLCFLKELARHPRFAKGATSTKFIPQEFPDGFHGVLLTAEEKRYAVTTAVLMHLVKADTLSTVEGQLSSYEARGAFSAGFFVHLGGQTVGADGERSKEKEVYEVTIDPAASTESDTVIRVVPLTEGMEKGKKSKEVCSQTVTVRDIDWELGVPLFRAHMDGGLRTLQCLASRTLGYDLFYGGAYLSVEVYEPREQALLKHMLPVLEVDNSKYLQCPMPGQLISLAVQEGDVVEVGQELAIVEAMKMQNILRAPKKTTIQKLRAEVGSSLKVDQVILEFAVPGDGGK
jgi:propionyl-CoA carboxylase alpha chain